MDTERSSTNSSTCRDKDSLSCSALPDTDKAPLEDDLPPVDGGFHAWMFLAASTMIEALVWGFAFSFGVFESYYRDSELLKGSNMVAVIGTCATGVAYLSCPVVIVVMILLPGYARWFSTAGMIIMCLSLALGSFSTNITHLVLSQGIGFGIGGCIAYSPSIMFMSEWFDKRRGLAFGMVWAGSGVSGILFPLLLGKLLNRFGFQTTLRICSVLLFVLAAPFLYFHRPRLPISKKIAHHRLNARFLRHPVFVIYQASNVLEAFGFFLPAIYLPTFARSIGASELLASLTVTALNLASVFGSISMGHLSDRCHAVICISISSIGTVLSIFLLWGFSTNIAVLMVFSVAYGIFAGSYSAAWSGMIRDIQHVDTSSDATIVFSVIAFGRGIGNVVSGPFSEFLLRVDNWTGHAVGAYGTEFGLLVVCTGLTALTSGMCLLARFFKCI
ncbi:MFS monocarboxylate transporter [Penicillium odoratum]|uniref:MFS monocarboxylate transporter n=1 Tax=Penicillium odoratum TaxID=1167516 RepID=UPI0025482EBA|nr:MFS monocarboxylate transporter [Penicillium odoratum]KAJ5760221.1 MFS monocarboxylate transporter [Penicillium odoratum]